MELRTRRARIRVHYPVHTGQLVLRCDADWNADVEPTIGGSNTQAHEFQLPMNTPFSYFKPVLLDGDAIRWAIGDNALAIAGAAHVHDVYPYFSPDERCSACELRSLDDTATGRTHRFRVFYPPGYHENEIARYPVLYMQDGQNVFFADEAFLGQHWRVPETLHTLDAMNAIGKVIVVGIYPNERERDYTAPGYEAYGRFVVNALKPLIDAEFRTIPDAAHTAVMGSSLGGVVSFYLAWEYPEVFGMAACMSSTFGWRDDLKARVMREPRRPGLVYLDSGWPRDNYEVTRAMRTLMLARGYREGVDLHYYAFPEALHNEQYWAMRCHLPFQLFFDRLRVKGVSLPNVDRTVSAGA